ncbi:MAG: Oligopeptide transport ATP-binding protein OppF [Modestobacter sp.]|nr:Oligopeptide transport ATP-binding protein OppF [Modestobacter sp.]
MPAGEVVLEAQDLVRTYATHGSGLGRHRVSAVDGVSITLGRGEALGVVGEPGCGKSTLARMLVGLEQPDSGRVLVDGKDLRTGLRGRGGRLLRRRVQMIFQDPFLSLNPRLTVAELVSEPIVVHRLARSREERRSQVGDLLDRVGLSPAVMNRFPHQFSGGRRQRIGIARALAAQPEVLICDEPVSALDVSVQAQVVNLLRRLQREDDIALVFIAHDLSVVRHVADRIAVMYLGRLAETGDARTVYDRPAHPYTQALLSAVPTVDPAARDRLSRRVLLDGDPPSPVDPPSGCRFHTRCRLATEVCSQQRPELLPTTGDASVSAACHHVDTALAQEDRVRAS